MTETSALLAMFAAWQPHEIVGSLANIIVVERARQAGVVLGFWEHACCGIPITLLSFGAAVLWFSLRGG